MKAKTRIYLVGGQGGLSLIRAYSSTQARSFVAEKAFSVEVASQETLIQTLGMGVKVVDAAKPETADAFESQDVSKEQNGALPGPIAADPYEDEVEAG